MKMHLPGKMQCKFYAHLLAEPYQVQETLRKNYCREWIQFVDGTDQHGGSIQGPAF
jgi:hypothetical protein